MSAQALKLCAYVGERDQGAHALVTDELLALFERERVRTSVMLRGIEGFGLAHSIHTERLLTLSEDLPVVALAIDESARVEALLPDVRACCPRGLITLERARFGGFSDGAYAPWEDRAAAITGERPSSAAVKLSIFLERGARVEGQAAHVAAVEALHRNGAWGASVLLGLDGTLAGERRRARVFARNRGVPLMVMAVAPPGAAAVAAPQLERVAGEHGALVLERVQVCKRDGVLIGRPQPAPAQDAVGRAYWQKLAIYSNESTQHGGEPLHAALVRRLRAAGAAGATSLRGQFGFHGEHAPYGERLLALERHAPVLTVTIDTPQKIDALFEVVDELTARTGLVTSEIVPAMRAAAGTSERGGLRLAQPRL